MKNHLTKNAKRKLLNKKIIKCAWIARPILSGSAAALSKVSSAKDKGVLQHPSKYECVDCGKIASTYDHRDYNKPLQVDPVCRSCNILRGPGRMKDGFFEGMIALGHIPFMRRKSMIQVAKIYGYKMPDINSLPHFLKLEHWIKYWPTTDQPPTTI